jgi:cysteine desulfurase
MQPWFTADFANASSQHAAGQRARRAVDEARRSVARLLGCESGEVLFTSGGTEGDNLAILGVGRAVDSNGHVVVSAIEHKAVLEAVEVLEEAGMTVTRVPAGEDGVVDAAAMIDAMRDDTRLVALMLANNETGAIQPVAEVASEARRRGAVMVCDAVQALGRMPVRPADLGVDLMVFSGHKVYGPKGVGVLYQRFGTPLAPVIVGGRQEYGKRGGTTNVPLIVGMAAAMRLAAEEGEELAERTRSLAAAFLDALDGGLDGTMLNGHPEQRLPNTVNLSFEGVHGAALVQVLDMAGVAVSTGSACMSGSATPSHVLRGMGHDADRALQAVRFSFGRLNQEEQIPSLVEAVIAGVRQLRNGDERNGRGHGDGKNGGALSRDLGPLEVGGSGSGW